MPANQANYEQAFRLRMWIDETIDFSPVQDENGQDVYPYNDKTFTVTVNVYANAKVVTDEEITLESNANINSLSVDGNELTQVTDQDYDYETSLPEGTTSTVINVETESENATVTVERVDGLAYNSSSKIKRLTVTKSVELTEGDNYFKITVTSENKEAENKYIVRISVAVSLTEQIFSKYTTIYENPTLTTSSNNTTDASGLYKSTATNSGETTYYFRGIVDNNYVDFAGFTWRVVRINEDGTIRLIMQDGINDNAAYVFNSVRTSKENMYYSKSDTAKPTLETWYTANIVNKGYSDSVVAGNYFCEQAKVAYDSTYATNSGADMIVYVDYTEPNFKCTQDANGYGIVNASVGLLSYDEVLHAGGYYNKANSDFYLCNNTNYWTMSPAGIFGSYAYNWRVNDTGDIYNITVSNARRLRAVLNLKADVKVTGSGTSGDHWVVQ